MILILIFAEAIGLYGLIVAIIMSQWRALVSNNDIIRQYDSVLINQINA
jgi:hypothetical protein